MAKMTVERFEELESLIIQTLEEDDPWQYHKWDGFIECDETMTDEELEWLSKNATIEYRVILNDDVELI